LLFIRLKYGGINSGVTGNSPARRTLLGFYSKAAVSRIVVVVEWFGRELPASKLKSLLPRRLIFLLEILRKSGYLQKNYPDIFLAEILFTLADVLGGHLKNNNPDDFNFRVQFLNKAIENY
jgi:hypothetical protein